MAGRAVRWLAWAVVPLALLGYGLYLALGLSSPRVNGPADFSPDDATWVLGQVAYAIVGAMVASRRPEFPIGWLFCAAGLLGVVEGIAARVAVHAFAADPGRRTVVRPPGCRRLLVPHIALLVLGALLFPSGRPPSRGWWAVAWLLAAGAAVAAVAMVLLWPARGLELLDSTPQSSRAPVGTAVMNAAALTLTAAGVATVVALLVRLKRSRGVERQQVKWLTYAGALAIFGLVLLLPGDMGLGSPAGALDVAGTILTAGAGLGLPIAVGVAILRYRLFDIDLLITRTVVYGLLTAPHCGVPGHRRRDRHADRLPRQAKPLPVDRRHRRDCGRFPTGARPQSTTGQSARVRQTSHPVRGVVNVLSRHGRRFHR